MCPEKATQPPTETVRILVVDDEILIRESLAECLCGEGFEATVAASAEQAMELTAKSAFDICLCDIHLPGKNGLQLLDHLGRISPETHVILITAYGAVETAVEAFQRGAHDYLIKPILLSELIGKITRLLEHRRIAQENQWLRRELHRVDSSDEIIGKGPEIQEVLRLVDRVAPTGSTVLITGESGTGKELIARRIHQQCQPEDGFGSKQGSWPRSGDPRKVPARWIAVNCAAIPRDLLENQLFGHRKGAFTGADKDQPGVFLHAGTGTVFLDEIAELSPALQAKLLRSIEQKEVFPVGANEPVQFHARIVAATNNNLKKLVETGQFREDLYYRLGVFVITIPPLRERREDIPALVEHFIARHSRSMGKRIVGIAHDAMTLLRNSRWKGNVRELENTLQRAVILCDHPLIGVEDLPGDLVEETEDPQAVDSLDAAVLRFEKRHIQRMISLFPDKKEAAKRLDMALSSLYRRISELGIAPDGK
ncbi:MAG: sigma-54-dependent Fis family transcriptional regulator [Gemmataceae bacterium]|nr:sigma-54-dependent Fis family transcriptional regulator [Gemmataceae bacterium]